MRKERATISEFGNASLWYVNNSAGWWDTVPPGMTQIAGTYPIAPTHKEYESIQYENTGGRRFGRCYHRKDSLLLTGAAPSHAALAVPINDELGYYEEPNYAIGSWLYYMDQFQSNPLGLDSWEYALRSCIAPLDFDSYDWDAFSSRSLEAMVPSLEDGFSVLNFLYELRDLRTLFTSVIGKFGLRKGASWKQLFKAAAGAHLTLEFAIKPLLSDLTKIFDRLFNLSHDLESWREKAGRPQTRHYVENDEIQPNEYVATHSSLHQHGMYASDVVAVERHATMRYVYSLPKNVPDILLTVLGFMARLGINPARPSIIWNAIPFTFLIDWIIDVGDWLDAQSAKEILPVSVKVLDYCVSQKFKTTFTCELRVDPAYTLNWGGDWGPLALLVCERYQRERMVPTISSASYQNQPGLKQLSLATSLLVAVSGKRKR